MITNLCFHGIGTPARTLEPDEDGYWISPDFYAEVLDLIADRPDVVISFDDGNASDIAHALEGLLRHGRTATFFVLAGRLDQAGSLSRSDLQELRGHGMVIGTHGMDHVPWRFLSPPDRRRELVEARELISEAAGAPVCEAALPLGRYDRAGLAELRRLGYHRVYSSDRRRTVPAAWLQPRYSVRATDTPSTIRSEILTTHARHELRSRAVGLVKQLR